MINWTLDIELECDNCGAVESVDPIEYASSCQLLVGFDHDDITDWHVDELECYCSECKYE